MLELDADDEAEDELLVSLLLDDELLSVDEEELAELLTELEDELG